jgi:hypothetical protein
MRLVSTKLRGHEYEKFVDTCKRIGKSPYAVLRELILKWLQEQGVDIGDPSQREIESIKKEVEDLKKEVSALKRELEALKERKATIEGFAKKSSLNC